MLNKEFKEHFGKRIRELRTSKGFTQEVLAEKIGIEPHSLSRIENGKSFPLSNTLTGLIEILEIKPKDIFDFYHQKDPEDLIKEINECLKNNPDKLQDIYKIVVALTE